MEAAEAAEAATACLVQQPSGRVFGVVLRKNLNLKFIILKYDVEVEASELTLPSAGVSGRPRQTEHSILSLPVKSDF